MTDDELVEVRRVHPVWERRAKFARKMWERRGTRYMASWFWLEPAAIKPSKRGRRG